MTFSRLAVFILCALPLASQAQIRATTDDGKRVQLLPDGTWKYETAAPRSSPTAAKSGYPPAEATHLSICTPPACPATHVELADAAREYAEPPRSMEVAP